MTDITILSIVVISAKRGTMHPGLVVDASGWGQCKWTRECMVVTYHMLTVMCREDIPSTCTLCTETYKNCLKNQ